MARIWSEPFDPNVHRNPMGNGWGAPPAPEIERYWRGPTLERHKVLLVRVCEFTFEFHNREQLLACRDFYTKKHQPTSRLPVATGDYGGDQTETQRWFERLPLYLREEAKRIQVVAALDDAAKQDLDGKIWETPA
jgi:hypothetical protein